MLSLLTSSARRRTRLSRRELLRLSSLGAMGLSLPEPSLLQAAKASHKPTAKRCIFIFLCGGPSQLDMWDLKPEAPDSIRGPFQPIQTSAPGFQIGELLPEVAKQADKFSIIRSMNHNSASHATGIKYMLLADSGPETQKLKAFPPQRSDHPGMGAILQSLQGSASQLPPWVTVPRPFTTGSNFYKGQTAGFLGGAFDPLYLNVEKRDSLAEKQFTVKGFSLPDGVDAARFQNRRQLLDQLKTDSHKGWQSDVTQSMEKYYERAFSMLSSEGLGRVFDLEREPVKLRDRYGRNEYGQSFLLARRLIEADVQMVNVFWTYYGKDGCQFNLWDNHGSDKPVCGGYNNGLEMIRGDYCCPAFDLAYSALLEDLSTRGLLDDTMVVVTGEFGRTPQINKNTGRDHWPNCYSTVLAGGGIKGGQIYGESDKHAAFVKNDPVRPEDLGATILHAFGYRPEATIPMPTGREIASSQGKPVTALF
ncbi:MAG: DUF1501 domain-containing protein [Planctomycetes bacterium]|nr:DUF1501 domain-containing protein [Planctomycetota bacterium]MCH9725457.1 DUF1501 domain-containing protein [Planctomycetota bacterium]MCH9776554.1 DUF1501 domain-containing protein [Planctomycetota bacterium]MCH9789569.1 DUF1501 domain-containing protein [Planctomycetota bacterium]